MPTLSLDFDLGVPLPPALLPGWVAVVILGSSYGTTELQVYCLFYTRVQAVKIAGLLASCSLQHPALREYFATVSVDLYYNCWQR